MLMWYESGVRFMIRYRIQTLTRCTPLSCGMILQSQLFGRKKICGDAPDDAVFCTEDSFQVNKNAIHKIDLLSIGNDAYTNYIELLTIQLNSFETYANFEE